MYNLFAEAHQATQVPMYTSQSETQRRRVAKHTNDLKDMMRILRVFVSSRFFLLCS